jgi:broad specificity phosphatase PhoE
MMYWMKMQRLAAIAAVVTIGALFFSAFPAHAAPSERDTLLAALRQGGAVLLLRHAQTDPGVGDPPGFTISECKTQRNLSAEGIAQAQRMGVAARDAGIRFTNTFTSQWCRCRDTARLITAAASEGATSAAANSSKAADDWPALNSFFDNSATQGKQTEAVKARIGNMPENETWLLVTHQVNITALTGVAPAMGEGVVLRRAKRGFTVLGRLSL